MRLVSVNSSIVFNSAETILDDVSESVTTALVALTAASSSAARAAAVVVDSDDDSDDGDDGEDVTESSSSAERSGRSTTMSSIYTSRAAPMARRRGRDRPPLLQAELATWARLAAATAGKRWSNSHRDDM
jgi:hypothetical protein